MGKEKEPLDGLTGRVATGIHQVAAATIVARDAKREELDLAALILRRDPEQSAPRENESTVEAFNRILDVAIESANDSACCGTRAERRSRLCSALDRAGVVMLDHHVLADFVEAKLELDQIKHGLIVEAPGPIPLLEALEEPRDYQPSSSFSAEEEEGEPFAWQIGDGRDGHNSLEFVGDVGRDPLQLDSRLND